MTTGERIRQRRKELGLTQEELGERIGVQKAAINKYETGLVVNLKQSTIAALSKALDISPIALLGADSDLSPQEEELLSLYRSLSPKGRDYLWEQATVAVRLFGEKYQADASSEAG